MNMQEEYIFTNRGMVPVTDMDYKTRFIDDIELTLLHKDDGIFVDKGGSMTFVEEYFFKDNGEIAKRSVHPYLFHGFEVNEASGRLN